jgi:ubiquinone/menaquinone biosynthesis C-methylase UbiE
MKGRRPADDKLSRFFLLGEQDVDRLMSIIRSRIKPDFAPGIALDYGCGVGRVLIPLSRHCQKVIGMDISESMMAEAADNCRRFDVTNAEFVKADDLLSLIDGGVDLVHTHEVLQHIPVKRGMVIIKSLVDRLNGGGVGYLQFPSSAVSGRIFLDIAFARRRNRSAM